MDLASASAAAAIGVATTVRDEEDSQDNRLNSRAQDENSLFTHQQPSKVCFHVVPLLQLITQLSFFFEMAAMPFP